MKIIADLCVVPSAQESRSLGRQRFVSASSPQPSSRHTLHAYITNIEGDRDQVFAGVKLVP
jgi:uncharacterized protein YqgV (UPF0045/DUF77 family)